MEQKILSSIIKDREAFDHVQEHLDESDFSAEGNIILGAVRDYYSNDPAAVCVDIDLILGGISRRFRNPKHFGAIETVLRNLPHASPGNVAKEVLAAKRDAVGLKLASALSGGRDKDQLARLLESYNSLFQSEGGLNVSPEEEVSGLDLPGLVTRNYTEESLVRFRPHLLNERFDGGARPGHHILVFAPTEMGKTLFAINMVSGFLQDGHPVLYIGNEDPIADIQMRLASNISGLTKHEILDDPEGAMASLKGSGVENFHICEMSPGTFPRINKLVDKYKPTVLVLDQLRNIDVKQENRTQALERAATEARNTGKRNGLVTVSLTQAGDSASGRRVLTRGDVDGSNVGIPGQCDAMVGLGATAEEESNGFRTVSFPKNKLGGNHLHFTCSFDYMHSRVIDHAA